LARKIWSYFMLWGKEGRGVDDRKDEGTCKPTGLEV
jgi:hypothetical protein